MQMYCVSWQELNQYHTCDGMDGWTFRFSSGLFKGDQGAVLTSYWTRSQIQWWPQCLLWFDWRHRYTNGSCPQQSYAGPGDRDTCIIALRDSDLTKLKASQRGDITVKHRQKSWWLTSALGVQDLLMKRASFPKVLASTHISTSLNFE